MAQRSAHVYTVLWYPCTRYRYKETRDKCRCIGADNKTCTGACSHRQSLADALAPRSIHISIVLWYTCIGIKGRGVIAGALSPATGHAPARIPIVVNHSLRHWPIDEHMYIPFYGTHVSVLRDEGHVPAPCAGNKACTGTCSSRRQPLAVALAQRLVHVFTVLRCTYIGIKERGASAGAFAPPTRHAPHVFQSSSNHSLQH